MDEIVVWVKREGVSVLNIPAAVSVLGGHEITKPGIANTQDFQARVPSLITSYELGIPNVFICGIVENGKEGPLSFTKPQTLVIAKQPRSGSTEL
ncbi:hypothetical protein [Parasphingorhabdus sp.]|jgi:hypothetical protein|uniref:hypothetical protein n=1 Tax=Parasphingorhabdus sp. TaxID=2709688 RepID=UPI003001C139